MIDIRINVSKIRATKTTLIISIGVLFVPKSIYNTPLSPKTELFNKLIASI